MNLVTNGFVSNCGPLLGEGNLVDMLGRDSDPLTSKPEGLPKAWLRGQDLHLRLEVMSLSYCPTLLPRRNNLVRVARIEPAWACSQGMWVAATLHPDWWLVTELNRVHWLFRPALCRRVHEPLVDGARVELAFHGCRPWVIPSYEPPIGAR